MKVKLIYNTTDQEAVKTVFELLMFRNGMNKATVLTLMKNNPLAIANGGTWAADLEKQIGLRLIR